ncbi:transcriptional regulator [Bacillus phage vB_BcoS-136]|uniref:Uncharacterized protein n=1 Tax=Bacillus phage vB_BcoS-136 TaxID=2419619 RepID=A0A3G3BVH9_9CAUD|nr:transcriptional regulator [Bacillus phage vB_BcoS-136]AYP68234.1 hypothetical protein vBBcoS136_00102 [Bacillus phage vB_BcoS-136]
MFMYEHFKNIQNLYGDAYVQIPNGLFRDLSSKIKDKKGSTNIQQTSFAYSYLVTIAFLYKYAHFVDLDNNTYIQNNDIKQILGYGRTTKTIDKIIKKGGLLEDIGLVQTNKDYPVRAEYSDEEIDGNRMIEFTMFNSLPSDDSEYMMIKSIVKNRNYEIREPMFLFEYKDDVGTLYNYECTHRITIKEFIDIVYDENLDNIDFMMYSFFKSQCLRYKSNSKPIPLNNIISEIGIGKDAFYNHLENLKNKKYVNVLHKGWKIKNESEIADANEYHFMGIS